MRQRFLTLLALVQVVFAIRVILRLAQTAGGRRIRERDVAAPGECVTVLVPVLNEAARIRPCLDALLAQPPEVSEILVIDGGSTDATTEIVASYGRRDRRVRLINAAPVPDGVNGKAHGLQVGLDHAGETDWVLTIDADVRPAPALTRSLLAMARETGDAVISVATNQRLSGPGDGILHPALLTTLVYRYGIPGHATRDPAWAQANGQCCLFRRRALAAAGGFRSGLGSVCEDVTVAREVAASCGPVGFYEADDLVWTEMYTGWRDAWTNWTRSLPMLDHRAGLAGRLGLVEVLLVQALPLVWVGGALLAARLAADRANGGGLARSWPMRLNLGLVATRLGVLAGTARAYPNRPWTYWLSPLVDLPVAIKLLQSAFRRQHTWRGRTIIRTSRGDSA